MGSEPIRVWRDPQDGEIRDSWPCVDGMDELLALPAAEFLALQRRAEKAETDRTETVEACVKVVEAHCVRVTTADYPCRECEHMQDICECSWVKETMAAVAAEIRSLVVEVGRGGESPGAVTPGSVGSVAPLRARSDSGTSPATPTPASGEATTESGGEGPGSSGAVGSAPLASPPAGSTTGRCGTCDATLPILAQYRDVAPVAGFRQYASDEESVEDGYVRCPDPFHNPADAGRE